MSWQDIIQYTMLLYYTYETTNMKQTLFLSCDDKLISQKLSVFSKSISAIGHYWN